MNPRLNRFQKKVKLTCLSVKLFQISGLKLVYHIQESNHGSRLNSIKTRSCPGRPDDVIWCDLDYDSNYTIAISNYLAKGIINRRRVALRVLHLFP